MSWLYERREQLDGLKPLVEVAHWLLSKSGVPASDRDDVEQDIIIRLMSSTVKADKYLRTVGRHELHRYWARKNLERRKLRYLSVSNKGEQVINEWRFAYEDGAADARLDAIAVLATLPKEIVAIGSKRLNGEKVTFTDYTRWRRFSIAAKLPRNGCKLTEREEQRVIQLHKEGLCAHKIAVALGRNGRAIDRCLVEARLKTEPPYMSRLRKPQGELVSLQAES